MHDFPIQNVESIDIVAVKKDGGVDLIIVASRRLDATPEIQQLLLDKIQSYLEQLNTEEFQEEFNHPDPEKTVIIVSCKENPDPVINELVLRAKPWVENYNARLELCVGEIYD